MATMVRTGPAGRRRESQARPEATAPPPTLRWYDRLLIAWFVAALVCAFAAWLRAGTPISFV
jgi:hypothetical protein